MTATATNKGFAPKKDPPIFEDLATQLSKAENNGLYLFIYF